MPFDYDNVQHNGFEFVDTRTPFDEVCEAEERAAGTFQEPTPEVTGEGVTNLGRHARELTRMMGFQFHDGFHPCCVYRRFLWSLQACGMTRDLRAGLGIKFGPSRLKQGPAAHKWRQGDLFGPPHAARSRQRLIQRVFRRASINATRSPGAAVDMFQNYHGFPTTELPPTLLAPDRRQWRALLAIVIPEGKNPTPLQALARFYALAWFLVPIRIKFLASLPECDVAVLLDETKSAFSRRIKLMFREAYGLKSAGMKSEEACNSLTDASKGNNSRERGAGSW